MNQEPKKMNQHLWWEELYSFKGGRHYTDAPIYPVPSFFQTLVAPVYKGNATGARSRQSSLNCDLYQLVLRVRPFPPLPCALAK